MPASCPRLRVIGDMMMRLVNLFFLHSHVEILTGLYLFNELTTKTRLTEHERRTLVITQSTEGGTESYS